MRIWPSNHYSIGNHYLKLASRKYKEKVPQKKIVAIATPKTPAMPPDMGEEISYTTSIFQKRPVAPYNPDDLVGKKGLKIYSKMMHDEQVRAAISAKQFAVLSTGYEIQPPETDDEAQKTIAEEMADFVEFNLDEMVGAFDGKLLEIMSSLIYGFSCTEIVLKQIDYGPFEGKIGLAALKTREPFTFDFDTDGHGNLLDDGIVQSRTLRMPKQKFILHTYRRVFDNAYGESDLRACYRAWFVKDAMIKFMTTTTERYGEPIAIFNHEQPLTAVQRSDLEDFIKNLQNRTGIILPTWCTLTLESPDPKVGTVFLPILEYMDTLIRVALLMPGLIGLSGESQVGSFARAIKEFDVFLWIVGQLREDLETIIEEQLIKPLCDINYEVEAGKYPKFKFKEATEELRQQQLENYLRALGARAINKTLEDEEKIREELGFPPPDPNAQTQIGVDPLTGQPVYGPANAPSGQPQIGKPGEKPPFGKGKPFPGKKPPAEDDEEEEVDPAQKKSFGDGGGGLELSARLRRQISRFGGEGSGNWGHEGRPGEVGGSGPGGKAANFQTASPDNFVKLRDRTKYPQYLSHIEPAGLANHKLIVSADGNIGAAVSPEGDIQNVFNNGGPRGGAADVLFKAIDSGGRTLDCFDGYLPQYYAQLGFKETGRMKFNPEFAPAGWTPAQGQPDVVFMHWVDYPAETAIIKKRLSSKEGWINYEKSDKYFSDWDAAKADSRRAARFEARRKGPGGGLREGERGANPRPGPVPRRAVASYQRKPDRYEERCDFGLLRSVYEQDGADIDQRLRVAIRDTLRRVQRHVADLDNMANLTPQAIANFRVQLPQRFSEELSQHLSRSWRKARDAALAELPEKIRAGVKHVSRYGGEGSGNWGHAGRPGEVGGSGPGGAPAGDSYDPTHKGEGILVGPTPGAQPRQPGSYDPTHAGEGIQLGASQPRRAQLKSALTSLPVKKIEDHGGGVNATSKIVMEDGTVAFFKPASGEAGGLRNNVPAGEYYIREAAASDVAEVLGMDDIVPPTVVREVEGKTGSAQLGLPGKAASHYDDPFENISQKDLARAAAFDYLIGNTDRHNGNWRVVDQKAGKIGLIDNGLAFPEDSEPDNLRSKFFLGISTDTRIADGIGSSWDGKWPALEGVLKMRFNRRVVDGVKLRYDDIISHKNGGFRQLKVPVGVW